MIEGGRDIPRAIIAHEAEDRVAVERAVRWLLHRVEQMGGQPLFYVPGKRNYQGDPVLV